MQSTTVQPAAILPTAIGSTAFNSAIIRPRVSTKSATECATVLKHDA